MKVQTGAQFPTIPEGELSCTTAEAAAGPSATHLEEMHQAKPLL